MATFSWIPSTEAAQTVKPRVLQAKFGDGYSQRVPDGLNTLLRSWQLTFKNRTKIEADAIEAFLDAAGGCTAFDWTPPDGAAGKWICGLPNGWQRVRHAGNFSTISCTFDEVPA